MLNGSLYSINKRNLENYVFFLLFNFMSTGQDSDLLQDINTNVFLSTQKLIQNQYPTLDYFNIKIFENMNLLYEFVRFPCFKFIFQGIYFLRGVALVSPFLYRQIHYCEFHATSVCQVYSV